MCAMSSTAICAPPTSNDPGVEPRAAAYQRHAGLRYTHDLRAVQDVLGHQDPKTTARYACVVDRKDQPGAQSGG